MRSKTIRIILEILEARYIVALKMRRSFPSSTEEKAFLCGTLYPLYEALQDFEQTEFIPQGIKFRTKENALPNTPSTV